jgi:hypothetical protein
MENGQKTFQEFFENPSNRFINVFVKENNPDDVTEIFTYTAKITCCLCNIQFAAHKADYGSKDSTPRKTRWIIANFLKHTKVKHMILRQGNSHLNQVQSIADAIDKTSNQPKINDIFPNVNSATENENISDIAGISNIQHNVNGNRMREMDRREETKKQVQHKVKQVIIQPASHAVKRKIRSLSYSSDSDIEIHEDNSGEIKNIELFISNNEKSATSTNQTINHNGTVKENETKSGEANLGTI